jgi:hypothetical protein
MVQSAEYQGRCYAGSVLQAMPTSRSAAALFLGFSL